MLRSLSPKFIWYQKVGISSRALWPMNAPLAVASVAGPAVLVEELLAALDVCALDFAVLVEQLVDEQRHAGVFARERVSRGTWFWFL